MTSKIPHMALVLVLEMNNTTNKIMGIGLVRNFINPNYAARIYKDNPIYNRHIYNSNLRIDREDFKDSEILVWLERLVFKGRRHYKRGQGITIIPWARLAERKDDLMKLVREFFEFTPGKL